MRKRSSAAGRGGMLESAKRDPRTGRLERAGEKVALAVAAWARCRVVKL